MARDGTEPILRIVSLSAGYGVRRVLHDTSLTLCSAEVVALFGPNGCGKSTALKCIVGLVPALGGEVFVDGVDLRTRNPRSLRARGIAYVPQGRSLFERLTVGENLKLGAETAGVALWQEAILDVQRLFPFVCERVGSRAFTLSGGEAKVVALAAALAARPRALLLDEPLAGLSPKAAQGVMRLLTQIRERWGVSALVAEQRVSETVRVADRSYVIADGSAHELSSADTLESGGLVRRIFFGAP